MLQGIRVIEVGTWLMVPAATAVLAEYGADVIKVENPGKGDPVRTALLPGDPEGVNLLLEQVNRGKRSITLDLAAPGAREVLGRLVATADVFVTNLLPGPRRKLRVDVDDIRADNPDVVYVRGSAVGSRGPEAGRPGFDYGVFWARSGFDSAVTRSSGLDQPVGPRPGFGDRTTAMNLAFGVTAALLARERTGHAAVVDVSLLGSAMWSNASDVVYSRSQGVDAAGAPMPRGGLGSLYRTADDRWILFNIMEADRWFAPLCRCVGRADLLDDPRFATPDDRRAHTAELLAALDAAFASVPLEEWRRRLADLPVAWEVVQTPLEASWDPQVEANRYLAEVAHPSGQAIHLVPAPVEFDETPAAVGTAPSLGAHTDEVLAEVGYDEAARAAHRAAGVFGPPPGSD